MAEVSGAEASVTALATNTSGMGKWEDRGLRRAEGRAAAEDGGGGWRRVRPERRGGAGGGGRGRPGLLLGAGGGEEGGDLGSVAAELGEDSIVAEDILLPPALALRRGGGGFRHFRWGKQTAWV